jgi:SAM-dependent methyltransferase
LSAFPYPLGDGTADWILCTQVLDDIPDHESFLRELNRILARNGGLILSVSFVWELHDLPHDYGRPSPEQLLLERSGFGLLSFKLWKQLDHFGQIYNINLLNIISKRSGGSDCVAACMNSLFLISSFS